MTCQWLLCWNCLVFVESGNYSNKAYVLCLYYVGVFPSEMYRIFLSDRLHRLYMEHFRLYFCDFILPVRIVDMATFCMLNKIYIFFGILPLGHWIWIKVLVFIIFCWEVTCLVVWLVENTFKCYELLLDACTSTSCLMSTICHSQLLF